VKCKKIDLRKLTRCLRRQVEPNSKEPILTQTGAAVMTPTESMVTMMKKRRIIEVIWTHRNEMILGEKPVPCVTIHQTVIPSAVTSIILVMSNKRRKTHQNKRTSSAWVTATQIRVVQAMLVAEALTSILEHQRHKHRSQCNRTQVPLISSKLIAIRTTLHNNKQLIYLVAHSQ
jgi:hypothetical protein